MNPTALIRTILGPARGNFRPFADVLELTAKRIFQEHIAEDDLKLTSDVCFTVAKHLFLSQKAVEKSVERCANRCWDQLLKDGLTEAYIGKQLTERGTPRMMVVYLATYAYFDKPYFQMIAEHSEYFTGQLSAVPSLP